MPSFSDYTRFQLVDFGLAHLEPSVVNTKSELIYMLAHLFAIAIG